MLSSSDILSPSLSIQPPEGRTCRDPAHIGHGLHLTQASLLNLFPEKSYQFLAPSPFLPNPPSFPSLLLACSLSFQLAFLAGPPKEGEVFLLLFLPGGLK